MAERRNTGMADMLKGLREPVTPPDERAASTAARAAGGRTDCGTRHQHRAGQGRAPGQRKAQQPGIRTVRPPTEAEDAVRRDHPPPRAPRIRRLLRAGRGVGRALVEERIAPHFAGYAGSQTTG
ncbi:MAG: hypothetical protein WKH64_19055 [Chloroflexia bacterium]